MEKIAKEKGGENSSPFIFGIITDHKKAAVLPLDYISQGGELGGFEHTDCGSGSLGEWGYSLY
jgi:hypothetical protein